MQDHNKILYLFSSNLRPLYAQDILDLLALPLGARFQFRYMEAWIERATLEQWRNLVGRRVLAHFSVQQSTGFHDPAFIPVRLGTVTNTEVVGNIYLVEFELDGYVSLRKHKDKVKPRDIYGKSVKDYHSELKSAGVPSPYESSAGLGISVSQSLDVALDQMKMFETTTEFLSKTESFRSARYFRVMTLRESGHSEEYSCDSENIRPKEGKFILKGGMTYELTLVHTQPAEIEKREEFEISADEGILRVIGRKTFEVSSRYDIIKIYLHAVRASTTEPRATVLAIDPLPGVQGPRLRIRIEVQPDPVRTAVSILGTAAGAIVLALPSITDRLTDSGKVFCVTLGALLVAWLTQKGFKGS